ncbi:hypothetical protein BCR39DRAFT_222095 [Naematelia encephala]|uniref:Uncharacterized protein n=1 Tax=Naematelia encephala TaxID=71784 RepID=A0A1Y2AYH5_9TREE|nr:hypothetical protein BCR39DRAFT_222095 [Naematelia encephala]
MASGDLGESGLGLTSGDLGEFGRDGGGGEELWLALPTDERGTPVGTFGRGSGSGGRESVLSASTAFYSAHSYEPEPPTSHHRSENNSTSHDSTSSSTSTSSSPLPPPKRTLGSPSTKTLALGFPGDFGQLRNVSAGRTSTLEHNSHRQSQYASVRVRDLSPSSTFSEGDKVHVGKAIRGKRSQPKLLNADEIVG